MLSDDLRAWLGPAADDLTAEQLERVADLSRRIDAFYPDPDEHREREAALSAVVQHLLGDTSPSEVRQAHVDAKLRAREAAVAATWVGVALAEETGNKLGAAREVGVDRMVLLETLGERARRRRPR